MGSVHASVKQPTAMAKLAAIKRTAPAPAAFSASFISERPVGFIVVCPIEW